MAEFVIPCDTLVRLSNIITDAPEGFKVIRIEDGIAVATNRRIMAIENAVNGAGRFDLVIDDVLLNQLRTEVPFSSTLTIDHNELLGFAVAKTTLGYTHSASVIGKASPDFDKWRDVVENAKTPAPAPNGGMYWDADMIARLAMSSPSGAVVFEEVIEAKSGRPTVIRDVHEYNWLGLLQPYSRDVSYQVATVPSWL